MKIVYSRRFEEKYPTNPVENPDRVKRAAKRLNRYEFVEPHPACKEDLSKIHGSEHIERVRIRGLYDAASLACGGAITAAEMAWKEERSFALIRPPGHHASRNRAWGLCFFNNMAVAVERIRDRARKVLILDTDLHYGDGTANIFRGVPGVYVVNIGAVDTSFNYLEMDECSYLEQVKAALYCHEYNLVAVSAGFDTYVEDWGGY